MSPQTFDRRPEAELLVARGARDEGITIESLLDLRDPLCRAELAASRITRDAWSEPEELAREIRHALRELDARIDVLAAHLRRPASPARTSASATTVVPDLLRRMRPVLATSGVDVEWIAPQPQASESLDAFPQARLRRAVLVALCTAIASLPRGGRVSLEAVTKISRTARDLERFAAPANRSDRLLANGAPQAPQTSQDERPLTQVPGEAERVVHLGMRMRRVPPPFEHPTRDPGHASLEALRDIAADLGGWLDVRIDPESALPVIVLWIGRAHGDGAAAGTAR